MSVQRETSPPPHIIRLRGPWSYENLVIEQDTASDNTEAIQTAATVRLPMDCDKVFGPRVQGVVLRRRFGRPSNLGASERVDLVIEQLDMHGKLSLKCEPLGEFAVAR